MSPIFNWEIPTKMLLVLSALILLSLAGCASWLPHGSSEVKNRWHDFAAVKADYDRITPGVTTLEQLKEVGFEPDSPNVLVLNYSEIASRFATQAARDEYMDAGVKRCLLERDACVGYVFSMQQTQRQRVGNFLLDFINVRRRTMMTGWRFSAVVVLVKDLVVHKVWSGQPTVIEEEESHNPLGPLQGIGESGIIHR